jgi:hypothetical protein
MDRGLARVSSSNPDRSSRPSEKAKRSSDYFSESVTAGFRAPRPVRQPRSRSVAKGEPRIKPRIEIPSDN